jgi:nicotinate-nucleotide pyrophosphorylase (carboxylating)
VIAGRPWFDACFKALDLGCVIDWHVDEGDTRRGRQPLVELSGNARALLTAERPALNFLQTLSGVATATRPFIEAVRGTHAAILDTRKTLPGLRLAQKYAVQAGGGQNQRSGLYDGILIKENHIAAAGGIAQVLEAAFRLAEGKVSVQIEVENIDELEQALAAGAPLILLDNFSLADAPRGSGHPWPRPAGSLRQHHAGHGACGRRDRGGPDFRRQPDQARPRGGPVDAYRHAVISVVRARYDEPAHPRRR